MNVLKNSIDIIKQHKNAYIILNAVFYGLVIVGMVVAFIAPEVQQLLIAQIKEGIMSGPLSSLGHAYTGGKLLAAIVLTFVINLLLGAFVVLNVTSAIIPFAGLLMGAIRAAVWGLSLSPVSPDMRGPIFFHYLTLLLEGQGYIIAMLAVYLHGKAFLFPRSVGIESRWAGYKLGLRQTIQLYVPVAIILAVAAIYEAVEVISVMPLFKSL